MRISIIRIVAILALTAMLFPACTKEVQHFDEPYGEGKSPLGIKINTTQVPVPERGLPGIEVTIKATGLLEYKDELIFRFNGEEAIVKNVTDDEITAIVPDYASSGVTSISVGDQVIFGPIFKVDGLLSVDPTFRAVNGSNGAIHYRYETEDGKVFFVGGFTDYDNKAIIRPINRIVRTFKDGTYDASLRAGRGANGHLNRILPFQGKYLIAGFFNGYDQRTENISSLTMLNSNGSIDTMGINTFRRPDQTDTIKYFPRFNGGVNGGIGQLYEHQGKILIAGDFRYYISRQYDKPNKYETRDSVILDSTEIRQIARLNQDATLDKTYRFDASTNTGLPGGNGRINTLLHTEGVHKDKLLVYGEFTTFDNTTAGRITRLTADGSIDPTFNVGGTGADYRINNVTYNPLTNKYLIVGNFKSYNGKAVAWLALLNDDGTLDETFKAGQVEGGGINEAKQLSTGLIVASGNFKTYEGVARNGFMILDSTGKLAPGYNSTGEFNGWLADVIEMETEDRRKALLLIGGFNRFDGEPVNNILRLVINEQ
ncbi:DUF5008 domain-containing protein [Albibacterium indicum]|uniref:DUF5008 domain-containing protein n=1 Tax=Albibacterium indicum TaxID=2292082 RepID=UPI000E46917D|nr:DUF5008 domain-containing protein [Pedobacter indicus]